MRHLTIIAVTVLLASGCVEPYPGWTVVDISHNEIPRTVKMSFQQDFPGVRIARAERSTFESRLSGHLKKYRLYFGRNDTDNQRIIYDAQGMRKDGFDFWFDQHRPNPHEDGQGQALLTH
jgi:hypothetical protein